MSKLTFRGLENQLVESHALATGGSNACSSGLGESEGGNVDLGDSQNALVVSDGANDDSGLALVGLLLVMLDQLGERQGRPVGARGDESSQNGLVETRASSSGEESEQL